MDKTRECVLDTLHVILGIEKNELEENMDLDLFENELLDSLGYASFLTIISTKLGRTIEVKDVNFRNMNTVSNIINSIQRVVG